MIKQFGLICLLTCVSILSLLSAPIPILDVPSAGQSDVISSVSGYAVAGNNIYIPDADKGMLHIFNRDTKSFVPTLIETNKLLKKPIDAAFDGKNIYLLDAGKSQVFICDTKGKVVRSFSTAETPIAEFKNPVAICVNYIGTIYVLDLGRKQILSFTNEGLYLSAFDVENPVSISMGVDQKLRLLSLENNQYKIDVLSTEFNAVRTYFLKLNDIKKGDITDIAINPYNELYIINGTTCRVYKVDETGTLIPNSMFGSKGTSSGTGVFAKPARIVTFSEGNKQIYAISDSKFNNIQFFEDNLPTKSKKLEMPNWILRTALISDDNSEPFVEYLVKDTLELFIKGTKSGNSGGRIVTCLSPSGKLYTISTEVKGKGFQSFDGMAVCGDSLFVTDAQRGCFYVFNLRNGEHLATHSSKGTAEGQLKNPQGIVSDGVEYLYICDSANNRISIFSIHGIFSRTFAKANTIVNPTQILSNGDGKFYVLCNKKSIVQWNPKDDNTMPVKLRENISGMCKAIDGTLAIADTDAQTIYLYQNKQELIKLGAFSSKQKQNFFNKINAIAYNPAKKTLLISDEGNNKTQQIKFYLPPLVPTNVKLVLEETERAIDRKEVLLKWDNSQNTNLWVVYAISKSDTTKYFVEKNQFVIADAKPEILSYRVASISDDNRYSTWSNPIIDEYSYAIYHEDRGNFQTAADILLKSSLAKEGVNVNPDICRVYYKQAQEYLRQMDYENALKYYGISKNYSASPDTIISAIVKVYKLKKSYKEGINYLVGLYSDREFVKREMLGLMYLEEDWDGTESCALNLLKTDSQAIDVLHYLALAYEKQKKYQSALDTYNTLSQLEPILANQIKTAEMLILMGRYDEAIETAQRLKTQYQQTPSAEIQAVLGHAYSGKKLYARAIECFNEATQLDSYNSLYYYYLGKTYILYRQTTEAIYNMKKAYMLSENDYNYGFELAQLYDKDGKLTEALEVMDKIKSYAPTDSTAIQYHLSYGKILLQKKRIDDAYREIGEALKLHPENQLIKERFREVTDARAKNNENRDPLEFFKEDIVLDQIFPSMIEYYKTHPIGYLSVVNTRNLPIYDVSIKLQADGISNQYYATTISSILAGDKKQVDLYLDINQSLLDLCEKSPEEFEVKVVVRYYWDFTELIRTEHQTLKVLQANSMNWDDRKQLASFVYPSNTLREYALNLRRAMQVPQQSNIPTKISEAMQVYSWLNARNLNYAQDPTPSNVKYANIDYVQFPIQTLNLNSGDCDDLVVLYSSLLSTIGINTGFLDMANHVIPVFDIGLSHEELEKSGFEKSWFIYQHKTYWMPIEITSVNKQSFYKSWMLAVDQYKRSIESGITPDLISFLEAHKIFPPVNFTRSIEPDSVGIASVAKAKYLEDVSNLKNAGNLLIKEEYIKTLAKYPDNLIVLNRYALWNLSIGYPEEAKRLWLEMLIKKPNHVPAMINLANVYLLEMDYIKARDYYLKALNLETSNKDNILRNICILEYKAGDFIKAKEYFSQMRDNTALKNNNPVIYLELIQ